MSDRIFKPGDRCGNYEILRFLGSGGMGDVYVARHPFTQMLVAIKCLLLIHSSRPNFKARMRHEAVTLAKAKHPNIVLILDGGITDDNVVYIVMELLEGQTIRQLLLGELLPTPGRFDIRAALFLGFQATDALSALHAAEIIHRDLKPENLFVLQGSGGVLKVIDFGLAKLRYNAARTTGGLVMGTPHYMSPEHLMNEHVDEKTDVYAMCAILWEMIAGRYVFAQATDEFPTAAEVKMHHLVATPKLLREQVPECPEDLSALIARGLSKEPKVRPTMLELGSGLRAIRRRESGAAKSASDPSVEPEDRASLEPGLTAITMAMESLAPSAAARAPREPDRLVVVVGPTPPAEFLLTIREGGHFTIGRAEEADISLNTPSVSRLHAEIVALGNGRYELVDRGSANGIQIGSATVARSTIEAGAVFEVGDVRLRLEGAPPCPDELPEGHRASAMAYATTEELYPPRRVVAAPIVAAPAAPASASRAPSLTVPAQHDPLQVSTPDRSREESAQRTSGVSSRGAQHTAPIVPFAPAPPAWPFKEATHTSSAGNRLQPATRTDRFSRPTPPPVAGRARAEDLPLWIAPLLGLGIAVVMVLAVEGAQALQATPAKVAAGIPSGGPATAPATSSAPEARQEKKEARGATEPSLTAEPASTTPAGAGTDAGAATSPPRATAPAPKYTSKPAPAPTPIRKQPPAPASERPKPVEPDFMFRPKP